MGADATTYVGRFAPSPTGPLHAGSLVAALASWLDARAAGGRWLVRIEDVDAPRCVAGATERILQQLQQLGLCPDGPVWRQSQRHTAYVQALDTLIAAGSAYACQCTRSQIAATLAERAGPHLRHSEWVYPGTCRHRSGVRPGAWRFACPEAAPPVCWTDRRLGPQQQDVAARVGDFVLRRADGIYTYQLAVVVDDAAQGVTHVVRGADLCDNTARQILLQHALGLPQLAYLHTPLLCGPDGEKLSKQHGAAELDCSQPVLALSAAAQLLGLLPAGAETAASPAEALARWVRQWQELYNPTPHDRS